MHTCTHTGDSYAYGPWSHKRHTFKVSQGVLSVPDAVQSIRTHTIFNSFTTNLSVCMWRYYTIWCFKNICFEIIKMTLAASRSVIDFPLLVCIMLYLSAHTNICLVLTDQTSFLWTVLFSLIYKICLFYTFVHTLITTVFNCSHAEKKCFVINCILFP